MRYSTRYGDCKKQSLMKVFPATCSRNEPAMEPALTCSSIKTNCYRCIVRPQTSCSWHIHIPRDTLHHGPHTEHKSHARSSEKGEPAHARLINTTTCCAPVCMLGHVGSQIISCNLSVCVVVRRTRPSSSSSLPSPHALGKMCLRTRASVPQPAGAHSERSASLQPAASGRWKSNWWSQRLAAYLIPVSTGIASCCVRGSVRSLGASSCTEGQMSALPFLGCTVTFRMLNFVPPPASDGISVR
mmetsp:Transcript_25763/g.60149  ORF Transcript_25763/g.60149 Transcript_25763/m.60149 type:complete len:243 (+) Transcript_25763:59-787(+)